MCWGCWIRVSDCYATTGCTGFTTETRVCPRCVSATTARSVGTSRRAVSSWWSWWTRTECSCYRLESASGSIASFLPTSYCKRSRAFPLKVGSRTRRWRLGRCLFWILEGRWGWYIVRRLLFSTRRVTGCLWCCWGFFATSTNQDPHQLPACLRSCAVWSPIGRTHPSSLISHSLTWIFRTVIWFCSPLRRECCIYSRRR